MSEAILDHPASSSPSSGLKTTSDIINNNSTDTSSVINNNCENIVDGEIDSAAGHNGHVIMHDDEEEIPQSEVVSPGDSQTLVDVDELEVTDEGQLEDQLRRHFPEIDVLIMSEAGKPIYCYSGREDVITLMGVCVALVNFVLKTQNDQLRSIHTRTGLHINFACRPPLVIVVVCRQHSCFDEQTLINQINAQIISTITLKSLKSVFQQAPTYDLKRLIHNNEFKTMDILVQSISSPIADLFTTYRDYLRATFHHRSKLKSRLFNNVISFYTSTSISGSSTLSSGGMMTVPSSLNLSGGLTNGGQQQNNNHGQQSSNSNNSLVVLHNEYKPNVLSRVYVPIAIIPVNIRDQITAIINQAVANYGDLVSSILFTIMGEDNSSLRDNEVEIDDENFEILGRRKNTTRSSCTSGRSGFTNSSEDEFLDAIDQLSLQNGTTANNIEQQDGGHYLRESTSPNLNLKLITVCNHNVKLRVSPLDIQLIYAIIKASNSQLSSTESLWLPLCLSRVDPNRFLYAHISYLSEKYCLVLLDLDHGDFQRCQQAKETIQSKLEHIPLTEPMTEIRSCISELGQPHLQYICHQTPRHCIMWQASTQTEFSSLNYYLIDRMQRSSLKTCWLRSSRDQCALLGWHSATFQLYAQFDITVTQYEALDTVQSFIKWFKKEEDKLIIKDN